MTEPETEYFELDELQVTKAGWQTTEFWLSVLVIVGATILLALGNLEAEDWKWAVTIVTGGYAVSRGLAKL